MPRTAWQAVSLHPLRFVVTMWPLRSLAYLVSGVAFGAIAGTFLVSLAVVGIALTVVVVGLGFLLAAVLFSNLIARVERWRMRLIDLDPAPNAHLSVSESGLGNFVRHRLREPVTWRELGFSLLSVFGFWWLDLVVLLFAIGAPIVCIRSAINDPSVWPWGILGLALIPSAPFTITIWAAARGSLARAMLSPRGAELGNELTEVKQSRARLVAAFDDERNRIERDLHDGAQQRLASLSVTLGIIRLDAGDDSSLQRRIGDAQQEVGTVMSELRDLVRGVRPQSLADTGLVGAVTDLATRSAVPVDVDVSTSRLDEQVEISAYFVVAECLTNITKHSQATRAEINLRHRDDVLVLQIRDNGQGGAKAETGGGLTGLADRLTVVDGRLRLSSPLGGPTLVHVEIPCRSI